jgi:hypothetical protein
VPWQRLKADSYEIEVSYISALAKLLEARMGPVVSDVRLYNCNARCIRQFSIFCPVSTSSKGDRIYINIILFYYFRILKHIQKAQ